MKIVKSLLNLIAISLVALGVAYKFQHWPEASIYLLSGVVLAVIVFFLPPEEKPHNKVADENVLDDLE